VVTFVESKPISSSEGTENGSDDITAAADDDDEEDEEDDDNDVISERDHFPLGMSFIVGAGKGLAGGLNDAQRLKNDW
jgi:hypothetical protein